MALARCRECGNEVSTTASSCPRCGYVRPSRLGLLPKLAAGALVLAVLVAIVSQPDSHAQPGTTTTASAAAAAPGSDTRAEGEQFLVGYTGYGVWRSWWSPRLTANTFLDQPPNAKYLFVLLSVFNNDNKARDVPPFKLVDENGAEYDADARGYMLPGSIGLIETLNPSVTKVGFVVFDVPPERHYRLVLSGGFWSKENAFVKLDPASKMPADPADRLKRLIAKRDAAK
jgi:hypothetical protein